GWQALTAGAELPVLSLRIAAMIPFVVESASRAAYTGASAARKASIEVWSVSTTVPPSLQYEAAASASGVTFAIAHARVAVEACERMPRCASASPVQKAVFATSVMTFGYRTRLPVAVATFGVEPVAIE